MNYGKRLIICYVLCVIGLLSGCNKTEQAEDKITIVCTNFALYDWTSQLLGDGDAEVILLLNNGTDMHSFQPSAEELIQIADCELLVHVGGESDGWLMDALEANPSETRVVVNLLDVLEADVCTEHCEEENHAEHEHSHETGVDEHVWLSLRMAVKSCEAIEDALCQVLPQETEAIRANGDAYCKELLALDQKYTDAVMAGEADCVVIMADRFPFVYMMNDYALEYYAAFPGCSTESEADFETVVFLAEKVKEHKTEVLLITESGNDTLATAVFENAGMNGETAVLHSMQVVYGSEIEAGASYIGYMEDNLAVLQRVLECGSS